MTAVDQGAARSQPGYELTRCGCGHLSTLHAIAASGARSGCSASTCSCRRFVIAEYRADAGRLR